MTPPVNAQALRFARLGQATADVRVFLRRTLDETRATRARARCARQASKALRDLVGQSLFRARVTAAARRGMVAIAGAADGDGHVRRHRPPVVLIVDDHADTREMYAQFLQTMGFATLEATTCAEALAKSRGDGIHAIVLDRRLPDGDGVDVCRELKADARTRHLPVVVLSGRQQDGASGADVYLMKPVVPDVLCRELERLLGPRGDGASS